ncbi:MAG: type II and III secretion system protein [Bdellovibrionales bacterium]|nr:type II and III secretion system protein [Bdellovibrionales bacterium]
MKPLILLCIFFLIYLKPLLGLTEPALILYPGLEKEIKTPNDQPIGVSTSHLLAVIDQGEKIKIVAKKIGHTHISINSQPIPVYILSKTNYDFYFSVQKLLKQKLGLAVILQGDNIKITGTLYRLSDFKGIQNLWTPEVNYIFNASIHQAVQLELLNYLNDQLENSRVTHYRVSYAQNILVVHLDKISSEATKILNSCGIIPLKLNSTFLWEPLIKVTITIAEVSQDFSSSIGIKWSHQISADFLNNMTSSNQLIAELKAHENQGDGQILATPILISKSGETSEFLAGGEYPVKTYGFKSQGVSWKRYGLYLKIKPLANQEGDIDLEIQTEISDIDTSIQTEQGIPAFKSNKLISNFNVKSNQLIMLSGLIQNHKGENQDTLPYLSKIPIFNKLFSSKNYRNRKSELVVFVKPELLKTTP